MIDSIAIRNLNGCFTHTHTFASLVRDEELDFELIRFYIYAESFLLELIFEIK